jgi:hypothetical protein
MNGSIPKEKSATLPLPLTLLPSPPILSIHGEKMYLVRGSSAMDPGKDTLRSALTMTVKENLKSRIIGNKPKAKYPQSY